MGRIHGPAHPAFTRPPLSHRPAGHGTAEHVTAAKLDYLGRVVNKLATAVERGALVCIVKPEKRLHVKINYSRGDLRCTSA